MKNKNDAFINNNIYLCNNLNYPISHSHYFSDPNYEIDNHEGYNHISFLQNLVNNPHSTPVKLKISRSIITVPV